MIEIKEITYEEDRLNYFKTRRSHVEHRYERWKDLVDRKESSSYLPYLSDDFELLSELGREISFYNDVIEMLTNTENNNIKHIDIVNEVFDMIEHKLEHIEIFADNPTEQRLCDWFIYDFIPRKFSKIRKECMEEINNEVGLQSLRLCT